MALTPRLRIPLLLALSFLLASCAPAPGASETSFPSPGDSLSTGIPSTEPVTVYPLTLTDDDGREVRIEAEPERIVSLAPSNTEIACAVGACDRLVGVTDFDDYPPEVTDVEKVVIFAQVDIEKVVAAEPDLVLAAGHAITPATVIDQLSEVGLTVLVLYPETIDEVYADIELVGEALNARADAAELVDGMRARVEAVEDAVAGEERPRTFYEVGDFEGAIYTAGEGSFIASLIETAGGDPITGDPNTTAIAIEDLVAADPELILLGDAAYDATITPATVAAREGWEGMTAVREGRILPMLDDLLITRPGPRVVDGLEALARAIHPEAFD